MKTFQSRWIRYGSVALYILLSFLSFYCACYKLPVGLKYGINLVVFAWACAAFFVSPQFEHALFCLRFFYIVFLSVPDVLVVVGGNMDYRVSKLAVYPAGLAKYYLYADEHFVRDWSGISF